MKKRLLAVVLCAVLAMTTLTACGSSEEETAVAPAVEEVETEAVEEVAANESMCSDETFAALQDAYASLKEANDLVVDYYLNTEDVEQNDDIEATLNAAQEYLDMVGEIQQDQITEDDAVEIAESMLDVVEGLKIIAQAMGIDVE